MNTNPIRKEETFDLYNLEKPVISDAPMEYIQLCREMNKSAETLFIVKHGQPLKYATPLTEWRA